MTLNEVNIIKNSVLDATEAYVDARLSVADFAKTQIGVTEGIPRKASGKYYHTVRCNAISSVADSGIVYHNVLSIGNTEFPDGSVVFLIAPNAQFSNQFILGKLDNTPIHITGGSISIGGTESRPNFEVSSEGVVRIRKGEITLGGSESAPNFRVDNDGNVYIKKGEINLGAVTISEQDKGYDVNLNKNGINLGYLGNNTYNFSVTDKGVMTMKKGSITLSDKFKIADTGWLAIGGTDSSANFYVSNTGKVTIKSGSINLGLTSDPEGHLTTQKYTFVADENGNLSVGAYPYQSTTTSSWSWQYHFKLTNKGDLTAGTKFKLDRDGNLFSGGTSTTDATFYVTSSGNMYVGGTNTSANFYITNDTNGKSTVRIKQGEITLGGSTSSPNFKVDKEGNVRIKQGEITLGGSESSPNFKVDKEGNIYIKKGEITIGTVSPTSSKTFSAFHVSTVGTLTMRKGSIRMDYRTTVEGTGGGDRYNVNLSSGGLRLGYLYEEGSGTSSKPYDPQYNCVIKENGEITIKRGFINLGLNSSDNKYNFSVTNDGVLFARSGEIAGFTINPNSLSTDGNKSIPDQYTKSTLSSTTLRVSKWTGSKRVSTIIDVNDNNGRIAINGNNASAPYMAVSSSQGWNDNGNFENPLKSTSNYVKMTPTSIALHEANESEYTVGAGCFKFLSQSQNIGDIGNLQINVSDNLVLFKNVSTGKVGILSLY